MQHTLLVVLAIMAVAVGFAPARNAQTSFALSARKSVALPFLNAPAKLDGSAVGDYGFDPLGFTDTLKDLHYVKEAEIKVGSGEGHAAD